MENPKFRSSTEFPARRRFTLHSETFTTITRILSLYDDQNQPSRLVKFVPYQLSSGQLSIDDLVLNDTEINTVQATNEEVEKKKTIYEGKVGEVGEGFDCPLLLARRSNEAQMALNNIADLMSTDEEDPRDLSMEKGNTEKGTDRAVDFKDDSSMREQIIVDELKAIMNGDLGSVLDNDGICKMSSFDETPFGDDNVEMEIKQQEQSEFNEISMDKFKETTSLLNEGEQLIGKPPEALSFSLGSNVVAPETIKNELILSAEVAVQQKASEASLNNLSAPVQMVVDEEPEEGELSDGSGIEASAPLSSENAQLPDDKLGSGKFSEPIGQGVVAPTCPPNIDSVPSENRAKAKGTDEDDIIIQDSVASYVKSEAQRVDRCDNFFSNGETELQQRVPNEAANISAVRPNNLIFYGDIIEENETAGEKLTPAKDVDLQKKRKRGPCSQQRKEKKKQKERKKRAEKNRELGVQRVKLQPVQIPKKISLCRHYIHGRCQEGEKCKFSHDTVPITKSTPCSYFARHSCMKGDKCPFDHDLSKYPCTKFSSNGFCNRGDSCLFSHKIKQEVSTSVSTNASGPDMRPPSRTNRPEINIATSRAAGTVLESLGISCKGMDQILASSLGKAQFQKFNTGSHPVKDIGMSLPIKSEQSNLSLKQKNGSQVNDQAKEGPVSGSSTEKITVGEKTSPLATPKGINFLSFAGSSSRIVKTELPKSDDTILDGRDEAAVKVQLTGSEKVTESSGTPMQAQGENPFGNDARVGSGKNGTPDRLAQEKEINELQGSSVKESWVPMIPHQQVEFSTPSPFKSRLSSAQKVLSSTLAFAARCEKEVMMKNHSSVDRATNPATSKETTVTPVNESARAQKILEFLSSFGMKK